MATVNFSVPDDIKSRFNKTFKTQNKSAILSRLMEQAIADEEQRKRRAHAVDAVLALRAATKSATSKAIKKARLTGRP